MNAKDKFNAEQQREKELAAERLTLLRSVRREVARILDYALENDQKEGCIDVVEVDLGYLIDRIDKKEPAAAPRRRAKR